MRQIAWLDFDGLSSSMRGRKGWVRRKNTPGPPGAEPSYTVASAGLLCRQIAGLAGDGVRRGAGGREGTGVRVAEGVEVGQDFRKILSPYVRGAAVSSFMRVCLG
jgi:hypothetical protein